MNQYELEQLWGNGSLPSVTYSFDDAVRLKSGERAEEVGRIVALLAIDPAPNYIIEFPDGGSARAIESDIKRAV